MAGDLVLLTGATGFIGFRVLVLLLKAGYTVRTAVRNAAGFEKIKALKSAAPYAAQMQSVIVPDITVPGAYNEASKGVKYIIHCAAPFAAPQLLSSQDYDADYIKPTIQGAIGILESAKKESGVKKVVITSSILAIQSLFLGDTGITVNEKHRSANTSGPWYNWVMAYCSAKAAALEASEEWMKKNNPTFNLINIEPVFVLGRDETADTPQGLLRGSNGTLLAPLVGYPHEQPFPGNVVHVEDVAMMHVKALGSDVSGNEDFLACAHPLEGTQWDKSFDIVKKHFPEECAAGIFKLDTERPKSSKVGVDSSKATKTFGINFTPYEAQVLEVAKQYVELVKQSA